YWGYDVQAALNGKVQLALGASVKFGADGATEGLFAVVRAFAAEPKARSAIADTIQSWRLPRQIERADSLAPGTWVIAEVDGRIAATIGAQLGYDFNWIRNVQLQGLSGDVGLKIQAAAEVALSFSVSGKYAVIVGRESLDPAREVLRVRLHKISQNGLGFALNASLGVERTTGKLLPKKLDQFVAGILGIHGQQILQELEIVR